MPPVAKLSVEKIPGGNDSWNPVATKAPLGTERIPRFFVVEQAGGA